MNSTSERQVYVHVQLPGTMDVVPAALLKAQKLPDGTFVGRFRYGDRYLQRSNAIALDPFALPLGDRVLEFTKLKGIPGAIRDGAPDAWGRLLMELKLERAAGDLDEIDYLLHGPQDGAGYLSFSSEPSLPPYTRAWNRRRQLGALIQFAQDVEEGKRVPHYVLEQLDPATSLGGARAKATIEDEGRLWLAKFPEKRDPFNIQRVESATLDLARRAGITVTRSRLQVVGDWDVLMLERFDRELTPKGYLRTGLVSALTVLDAEESHLSRDRWSYPLLADQLRRWSVKPDADRVELFRRMVFNAAVTNDDDHPRNHALLRTAKGWELTPAYDLVPARKVSQERRDLALTVGDFGRTASIYNLLSQSPRFGLSHEEARAVIDAVVAVVRTWKDVFTENTVSAEDIEYIAPAFLPQGFFFETAPQALP